VKLSNVLSRERFSNGIKSLGKLRIKTTHTSIMTFSALALILFIAFTLRVMPLRWEIESGSVIHLSEFDPYYQYSLVKRMTDYGLLSPYWPTQWVDTQRWYPQGINMGVSYPSLPFVAAFFYDITRILGFNFDLMSFCAMIPAIMAAIGALFLYFLGKDVGGKPVGLLAALFYALSSAVLTKVTLGFFTTENVGVVAIPAFSLLFLRAIEEHRPVGSAVKYAFGSAAVLIYAILGWGVSYYLIALAALFVFVLLLLKRYSRRLFLTYSITFGLGLLVSISTRTEVSPAFLMTGFTLPAAGVFVLLCLSEVLRNLSSAREKFLVAAVILVSLVASFVALSLFGYMGLVSQKFVAVIDPFLRGSNALVESVAEHRISSWGSIYYDLGIAIVFFVVGLFFVARNLTTKNLYLLLFGLTSAYGAASMVRLLFVFAPVYAVIAAVGTVGILKPFVTLLKEPPVRTGKRKFALERVGREFSGAAVFLIFLVLMTNLAFSPQSGGIPRVYSQAYQPVTVTGGSLSVVPSRPVTEWLDLLKYLNDFQSSGTVVCSWWDYGYWLSILGNVTSLSDNATINSTQIENVGFIFMANETYSLKMLKEYDTQYILVFVTFDRSGNWIDWAGGDNGKWTWMAKISGGAQQRFINNNFIDEASSWQNETTFGNFTGSTWTWNDVGMNATVYKLMSYAKNRWCQVNGVTDPDQVNVTVPIYFKEEFFSGETLSPSDAQSSYGGLVPVVALYKIDWQKYYNDYKPPA
jgi:dolichyl-diphosphooligosaccharide--protein glycosyltransferase